MFLLSSQTSKVNKIFAITKNELLQFFTGLSGYIFIAVFTLLNAWFFTIPLFITNLANLSSFFHTSQLLLVVFTPIITMNLISKEKQAGTIETIYTLPLKIHEFIIGKYLASLLIITISFIPSIVHLITIISIGSNVDFGMIFCGYLSLFLTSAVYSAIGIFVGSVSANQIISFIFTFLIILFFFLMEYILVFMPLKLTPILQYISITWQNDNLMKGVIDTRVLVYFASLIFIFIYAAISHIERLTRK